MVSTHRAKLDCKFTIFLHFSKKHWEVKKNVGEKRAAFGEGETLWNEKNKEYASCIMACPRLSKSITHMIFTLLISFMSCNAAWHNDGPDGAERANPKSNEIFHHQMKSRRSRKSFFLCTNSRRALTTTTTKKWRTIAARQERERRNKHKITHTTREILTFAFDYVLALSCSWSSQPNDAFFVVSFLLFHFLSLYTPHAAAGNLCVYAFERSPQQHDVCKARAWSECEWMEKKNCRWQNWPSLLIAFCCCCSRLESFQKRRPEMRKVTRVAGGRASFNFTNDKISSFCTIEFWYDFRTNHTRMRSHAARQ